MLAGAPLEQCLPSVPPPDMRLPPPGATAMRWAPPTASVTSEPGSASASLASLDNVATDARSTTSALAPKAVNVSLRGWNQAGGKDVAQPALLRFPPVSHLSHLAPHDSRS